MTSDPYSNNQCIACDIAIIGGGIAGLWLLNRLSQVGFNAVLLEREALGGGQTLASQGIIHGGLKYALNGVLSPASSAIAGMPARWARCLEGHGDIDLRDTRHLSENYYMWSDGGIRSRLKTFLGSKALRGRVDPLVPDDYPAFMNPAGVGTSVKGTVYRLPDFVVDTPSLLENLATPWRERIFQCADISISTLADDRCLLDLGNGRGSLDCKRVLLCAGEGNESLLRSAGLEASVDAVSIPAMQRRPLHMTAVRIASPAPAYVHCIGDSFGMTPRLTITAHPTHQSDEWVWYLGGELAEAGVEHNAAAQITAARKLLTTLFPWLPVPPAEAVSATSEPLWHTFFINRAEPAVADLRRPDSAYMEQCGSALVCWPVKLTLCPDLGDSALAQLAPQVQPSTAGSDSFRQALIQLRELMPAPSIAPTPWEHLR